jgi:hypothetical protein
MNAGTTRALRKTRATLPADRHWKIRGVAQRSVTSLTDDAHVSLG